MENYDRCDSDRPLNQTAAPKSRVQSGRAQGPSDEAAQETNSKDQMSISFAKGPKRKRLAKVRSSSVSNLILYLPVTDTMCTRPVTRVTKVNDVAMALVSNCIVNYFYLCNDSVSYYNSSL